MRTRWNLKLWLSACLAGAVLTGGQSLALAQDDEAGENQNQSQSESTENETEDRESEAESTTAQEETTQTEEERKAAERSQADSQSKMGEFEGTDENELRITINDETQRFETNEQTQVTINGERSQLDELKAGDRIRITTDESGTVKMVAASRGAAEQNQASRDPAAREQSQRETQQPGQASRNQPRSRQDQARQQQRSGQQQGRETVTLGVRLGPSPTTGVLIRDLQPQGPAEQAGLQSGDYILQINDTKIRDVESFDQALAQLQPGGRADITVWRDSEEQQLVVNFPDQRQAAFRPEEGRQQRNQRQGNQQQYQQRNQQEGRQQRDQRQAGRDRDAQNGVQFQENQGWLGVLLDDAQQGEQGVRIVGVYPSGPAARAGLRQGDMIVEVNSQDVVSPDEAVEIISTAQPNEQLDIVVMRGDQPESLTVMLADRRDFFDDRAQFGGEFEEQRGFRDDSDLVPEHAMMLEQHRRFAEQHERIEQRLDQVLQELEELRSQLGQTSSQPGSRPSQPQQPGQSQPGQQPQDQPETPELPEPGNQ